jgi:hypothetical protein
MDLTSFILIIVVCFLIYYLIKTISSLQYEIRDMKNKCSFSNNLKDDTPIIEDELKTKLSSVLSKIKNYI